MEDRKEPQSGVRKIPGFELSFEQDKDDIASAFGLTPMGLARKCAEVFYCAKSVTFQGAIVEALDNGTLTGRELVAMAATLGATSQNAVRQQTSSELNGLAVLLSDLAKVNEAKSKS
jgi:hypothetical protein